MSNCEDDAKGINGFTKKKDFHRKGFKVAYVVKITHHSIFSSRTILQKSVSIDLIL